VNEAIPELQKALDAMDLADLEGPQKVEMLLQLGVMYANQHENQKAIDSLTQALEQAPDNALAMQLRADVLLRLGRHEEAIADYEACLKFTPDDTSALNNLAWVLATSPQDDLRDGRRSIELAQKACELTDYKAAHILSTLASGYAESGDFDTAIKWSTKAVEVAGQEAEVEPQTQAQLQKELESYQNKQPWRELLTEGATPGPTGNEFDVPLPRREDLR
jgi:tetratricopeptide (TPR) repeat protein